MPETRSAISGDAAGPATVGDGTPLSLAEISGRDLVQLAAWPATEAGVAERLAALLGAAIPQDMRTASTAGALTLFKVAPERLWLGAPVDAGLRERLSGFAAQDAVVTDLGHARGVLRIGGPRARALLQRCVPIGVEPDAFPVGRFVQTGLQGVGVLLHRTADGAYDLYVPRSFARALWDWLASAAELCRTP